MTATGIHTRRCVAKKDRIEAPKEILPLPQRLHDKAKRLQSVEEIEALFPGFKAFTDATEQQIPRPKNKIKRRTHYSGKRKRHTVKTQLRSEEHTSELQSLR